MPQTATQTNNLKRDIVKVNDVSINVEEAVTVPEREKGLSGRKSLGTNDGMLFVLGKTNSIPTFWMKDMIISLDIIWIKGGLIIQIDKAVQPPLIGTADNKLKLYTPKIPVEYVLEVNSGFCDRNGIKVGDSVQIPGVP